MQSLLDQPHPPDAVFCYNDAAALVAMRGCLAAGMTVPHDVSIVGFDDIPGAVLGHRPLTTLRINKKELGALGVELLLRGPQDPPLEQVAPVELVVRASTVCEDFRIRKQVYDMMLKARNNLPKGVFFMLFEAYRPLARQKKMWEATYKKLEAENPHASPAQLTKVCENFIANLCSDTSTIGGVLNIDYNKFGFVLFF